MIASESSPIVRKRLMTRLHRDGLQKMAATLEMVKRIQVAAERPKMRADRQAGSGDPTMLKMSNVFEAIPLKAVRQQGLGGPAMTRPGPERIMASVAERPMVQRGSPHRGIELGRKDERGQLRIARSEFRPVGIKNEQEESGKQQARFFKKA